MSSKPELAGGHEGTDVGPRDPGLDLPKKILIVDDSPTIRATINLALKKEFGLVEAKDGEDAWKQLLADRGIQLVLTDLDMPGLDGYGLIQRMRGSGNERIVNTPVIVVTGVDETAAKERAFKAGANDFIAKTADHVELRARVRAHHRLSQLIRELNRSQRILTEQAYTDPLTKLTNRRAFFEQAEKSLRLMQRHGEDFSVVMIDIDHFKSINDTYGHHAGDYVLVEVSSILASVIRSEDMLARIGGEEFALALPYTSKLAAVVLAERVRRAVNTAVFDVDGKQVTVTISQGVVTAGAEADQTLDQLMGVADQRLYAAKQSGRDRVFSTDRDGMEETSEPEQCPRLGEALRLIEHNNVETVTPHLHQLLTAVLPLLEYTASVPGVSLDMANIRTALETLQRRKEKNDV